ncbi:MAG: hypothetical protein LBU61_01020 [Coriobacteriales bacterium]|jgi:rubrerythrin|nr:hypothetical protein [Coriobacteriales bacterium]
MRLSNVTVVRRIPDKILVFLLVLVFVLAGVLTLPPISLQAAGTKDDYPLTYDNLFDAVQGETNANAAYLAFAQKAKDDGLFQVANLFTATAAAEKKHADEEWEILLALGADPADRPVAGAPTVGTTAQNLQAAFDGETYEYTVMYDGFLATAQAEGNTDAARIFRLAKGAEEIHAGNFSNVTTNLSNANYLKDNYSVVYRCPVCGAVYSKNNLPAANCPVCNVAKANFVAYSSDVLTQTYANLFAAVQGETNANAAYLAFAQKAKDDGLFQVANLFLATAAAEKKHADEEWEILLALGADPADRPVAAAPVVGTTVENLQTAFDGETYEYTVMYDGFLTTAQAEGNTDAARIFRLAKGAEEIHAGNFSNVTTNLSNANYLKDNYSVVYRCPVCGAVYSKNNLPAANCPVCNVAKANFIVYQVSSPGSGGGTTTPDTGETPSVLWMTMSSFVLIVIGSSCVAVSRKKRVLLAS